jgi:hypothetical protein
MGIFVMLIRMVLGVFFMLLIAMEAAVPIIVATKAERKAMIRVVYKAFMMLSFLKSSLYQWRVKPPHLDLDFELLKESVIRIRIGA